MTEHEVIENVNLFSSILEIDPPDVLFSEKYNDIPLSAGLFCGYETVVFNPEHIRKANKLNVLLTIAHEVRHIFQMTQMKHNYEGLPCHAETMTWYLDCINGKSDTFEDSKEVDATVFCHVLISGLYNAGFDVIKMTDVDKMKKVYDGLRQEKWCDDRFKDVVFYDKENSVYIGDKVFL